MDEHVEINPFVCHGNPVIRGTRVLVSQILGALAATAPTTSSKTIRASPSDDVCAALRFGDSLASFEEVPCAPVHASTRCPAGIVVVALRQPTRAAIHALRMFVEGIIRT